LTARTPIRAREDETLSLEKTRELLGAECPMSDEELRLLLDQLRGIATIALDAEEAKADAWRRSELAGPVS
jgi:hypothetical protein